MNLHFRIPVEPLEFECINLPRKFPILAEFSSFILSRGIWWTWTQNSDHVESISLKVVFFGHYLRNMWPLFVKIFFCGKRTRERVDIQCLNTNKVDKIPCSLEWTYCVWIYAFFKYDTDNE